MIVRWYDSLPARICVLVVSSLKQVCPVDSVENSLSSGDRAHVYPDRVIDSSLCLKFLLHSVVGASSFKHTFFLSLLQVFPSTSSAASSSATTTTSWRCVGEEKTWQILGITYPNFHSNFHSFGQSTSAILEESNIGCFSQQPFHRQARRRNSEPAVHSWAFPELNKHLRVTRWLLIHGYEYKRKNME